jgi:hypothetical protein
MKQYPLGLRRLCLTLWAGGALLPACASEPHPPDADPLPQGSYGAIYDPPQLVGPTGDCIRSIPHAVLSVNNLGDFDLSVNTIDDCVGDTGREFFFGEVLHLGSYTRQGALLTFTPDSALAPLFTGTLEGEYVRLTLPPATRVAGAQVELVVGPREPF